MRGIECQREIELRDGFIASARLKQRGRQHAMRGHELRIHLEHVLAVRDRAVVVPGNVPGPRAGAVGAKAQRIQFSRAFDEGQRLRVA